MKLCLEGEGSQRNRAREAIYWLLDEVSGIIRGVSKLAGVVCRACDHLESR